MCVQGWISVCVFLPISVLVGWQICTILCPVVCLWVFVSVCVCMRVSNVHMCMCVFLLDRSSLQAEASCYSLLPHFSEGLAVLLTTHLPACFIGVFGQFNDSTSLFCFKLPSSNKNFSLNCKLACWDYRVTHLEQVFCELKAFWKLSFFFYIIRRDFRTTFNFITTKLSILW